MSNIYFVTDPRQSLSSEARQLERSKQRSHAATVSLIRRRAIRQRQSASTLAANASLALSAEQESQTSPLAAFDDGLPSVDSHSQKFGRPKVIVSANQENGDSNSLYISTAYSPYAKREPYSSHIIPHKPVPPSRLSDQIPHDQHGFRTDPFNGLSNHYSAYFSILMDYHTRIISTNYAPICRIFNVTNIFNSYHIEFFTQKEFLHISMARVQMAIDQRKQPGQKPSPQVLEHVGKAIGIIRRKIDLLAKRDDVQPHEKLAHVDEMVLIAILFLAICTRMIGDFAGYEVHRRSVVMLVTARGGLNQLVSHKGCIRDVLLQVDSFTSLSNGTALFPSDRAVYKPVFPTHPVTPTLAHQITTLPIGFRAMTKCQKITADVIAVLTRISAAQAHQNLHGRIVDFLQSTDQDLYPHGDIWAACPCLNAPDQTEMIRLVNGVTKCVVLPNFQKMLVLSLMLYCVNTFSPSRVVGIVYYECRLKLFSDMPMWLKYVKCKDRIERTQQMAGGVYPNADTELEACILIWMTYILIDSWYVEDGTLLTEGRKILEDLNEALTALKMWNDIETTLKFFFWGEPFLRRCQSFWLSTT